MINRRLYVVFLIVAGLALFIFQYQIFVLHNLLKLRNKDEDNERSLKKRPHIERRDDLGPHRKPDNYIVVNSEKVSKEKSYDESLIVLYNRVPKTGSTSFMKVIYQLAPVNRFNTLYVNVTAKKRVMNLAAQVVFVRNITEWRTKPAFYHGHFPYLNFARYGSNLTPIYINMVRDPIERMVSFYYFMRYGDNFRPHLKRQKMGDTTTIDECVLMKEPDCHPSKMWLQVQYFCGHEPFCSIPGNEWALKQAKRHLSDNYFLVGITEKMDKFIKLLEFALPRFFIGATKRYLTESGRGIHLRKTVKKPPMSNDTIIYFKSTKVWRMENEFYQFALKTFNQRYNSIYKNIGKGNKPKPDTFLYQKVKIYAKK
eukprot:gene16017-17634_t